MRRAKLFGLCTLGVSLAVSGVADGGPRIGGFDAQRGGIGDMLGFGFAQVRGLIQGAYPGVTFASTPALDGAWLSQVDLVILSSIRGLGAGDAVASLSTEESTALRQFVIRGGGVIVLLDNPSFDAANIPLAATFEVSVGARSDGVVQLATAAPNPLRDGPAGTVTAFDSFDSGSFASAGPLGAMLGQFVSGGAGGLVYFAPGLYGRCSGGVVLTPDSSMVFYDFTPRNQTLLLNAVAATLTRPLRGDFNGDRLVTVQDIFDFLAAWFGGLFPQADFNRDSAITVQDIFDFLAAWFAGC